MYVQIMGGGCSLCLPPSVGIRFNCMQMECWFTLDCCLQVWNHCTSPRAELQYHPLEIACEIPPMLSKVKALRERVDDRMTGSWRFRFRPVRVGFFSFSARHELVI